MTESKTKGRSPIRWKKSNGCCGCGCGLLVVGTCGCLWKCGCCGWAGSVVAVAVLGLAYAWDVGCWASVCVCVAVVGVGVGCWLWAAVAVVEMWLLWLGWECGCCGCAGSYAWDVGCWASVCVCVLLLWVWAAGCGLLWLLWKCGCCGWGGSVVAVAVVWKCGCCGWAGVEVWLLWLCWVWPMLGMWAAELLCVCVCCCCGCGCGLLAVGCCGCCGNVAAVAGVEVWLLWLWCGSVVAVAGLGWKCGCCGCAGSGLCLGCGQLSFCVCVCVCVLLLWVWVWAAGCGLLWVLWKCGCCGWGGSVVAVAMSLPDEWLQPFHGSKTLTAIQSRTHRDASVKIQLPWFKLVMDFWAIFWCSFWQGQYVGKSFFDCYWEGACCEIYMCIDRSPLFPNTKKKVQTIFKVQQPFFNFQPQNPKKTAAKKRGLLNGSSIFGSTGCSSNQLPRIGETEDHLMEKVKPSGIPWVPWMVASYLEDHPGLVSGW